MLTLSIFALLRAHFFSPGPVISRIAARQRLEEGVASETR
jgi:hypothetical protein